MTTFKISADGRSNVDGNLIVKKTEFDTFNESVLGLGAIDQESKPISTLAAIFDLEGFTTFCKQMDPHLAVPEFLEKFLKWIFNEIKNETIDNEAVDEESYKLWCDLPFFTKFMGDGLLFLWDTSNMDRDQIGNVILSLESICINYKGQFLRSIKSSFSDLPLRLRCGAARGVVYSIGDGNDYVGPCINLASRLQKISSLTIAFSRRGIDYNEAMTADSAKKFTTKKYKIKGIGDDENICILKSEFERLSPDEKEAFSD